jgi:uncharacterized membrane protein YkvA (DUF1232 family)
MGSRWLDNWRQWARGLKREVQALVLACRDPRTPWYAKWLAVGVVAYAFSPIDLIPDPIPVLGHLDDVILIPLGVALVRRLIPVAVLDDCRRQVDERAAARAATAAGAGAGAGGVIRARWIAAGVIIVLWLAAAALVAALIWRRWTR